MVSIGGCDDDDDDDMEDEDEDDDDDEDDEDDKAEAAVAVAVGFVEVMVGLADEGSILSADVLLSTVLVSESAVDFLSVVLTSNFVANCCGFIRFGRRTLCIRAQSNGLALCSQSRCGCYGLGCRRGVIIG